MAVDTEGRMWAGLGSRVGMWMRESAATLGKTFGRFRLGNPFSSLNGAIFAANLFVLAVVVAGVLYTSKYQAWLIDAKRESLRAQGEIMSVAIAWTLDERKSKQLVLDPKLFDATPEITASSAAVREIEGLQFPINPQRAAPILWRLIERSGTRARIYGRDGTLIIDSDILFARTPVAGSGTASSEPSTFFAVWQARLNRWLLTGHLPVYREIGNEKGTIYEEVKLALSGQTTPILLADEQGRHIVSVAVPIKRADEIPGALLLNTRGGEIEELIAQERIGVMRAGLIALAAALLSSLLLAGIIAHPVRQLARAAERVQHRLSHRHSIPDFGRRSDEIAYLSRSFRSMTDALCQRIDASEKFAADVSHELKNPLTSVRSAAETLSVARNDAERGALVDTIRHDVQRLTRLIDDIAKASRVDADISLSEAEPVHIDRMATTLVEMFQDMRGRDADHITATIVSPAAGGWRSDPTAAVDMGDTFMVMGHESRLGQVLTNLLDNALSFTPADKHVMVQVERVGEMVELRIEDEGPGIPIDSIDRVFARFYTDRPGKEQFGTNSGLGLSICREIVQAHGGRIWAENRTGPAGPGLSGAGSGASGAAGGSEPAIIGARFIVRLPVGTATRRHG